MSKAKVTVHPEFQIGEIDRKLFGGFLEPIRDWVYGGIYNPNHPEADEMGFRKDIMELTKELGMPAIRMPGGNFMSGWEWKDSIGPVSERKTHLDLAWRGIETNQIGHDEYLKWAEKADTEAIYTVNLGTGTIQDVLHCVEYTNYEGGTYWSDLRKEYGREKPYDVKIWCLGNEMDGPWQIGSWSKDPKGYGVLAHETSKVIKWIDPTCVTTVSGSSTPYLPTYPDWDLEVLKECYESVDYLSLHFYHVVPEGNIGAYLNASKTIDDFINTEIATCDFVQTRQKSPKQMMIAFDEYGCQFGAERHQSTGRRGRVDMKCFPEFTDHMSRSFDINDPDNPPERKSRGGMINALGISGMLMTILRHADRVKIGCMTGGLHQIGHDQRHAWKEVGFYTFQQFIKYAKGMSLRPVVDGPTYNVDPYILSDFWQSPGYENVPYIESCASIDEGAGEAAIFIINKNWEEGIDVELDVKGFESYRLDQHILIHSEDPKAANTSENPDCVTPSVVADTALMDGTISFHAPKLSFHVLTLKKEA